MNIIISTYIYIYLHPQNPQPYLLDLLGVITQPIFLGQKTFIFHGFEVQRYIISSNFFDSQMGSAHHIH